MGNVSHKGRRGGLTKFQKRKLKYDFHTFFGKKEGRKGAGSRQQGPERPPTPQSKFAHSLTFKHAKEARVFDRGPHITSWDSKSGFVSIKWPSWFGG